MESKWKKYKIKDIGTVVGGGTPKTNISEYWNGNIPWISPKDLTGYTNTYISKGNRNITELGLQKSSTKILPKGTVLLSSRAPIGYLAIASNDICTNQGFKSIIPNKNIINDVFLYYTLKTKIELLKAIGTGTTFAEISGSALKEVELNLPPLPEQKAIAQILSSLDDKIELNRQMNQTLEQMAQAMFKSWFVDFNPVFDNAIANNKAIPEELQAKAERRKSITNKKTLPKEIQELFPDEFELTEEMGWIPKGWKVDKFDVIAEVKYGKDHKKLEDGNIPVYGSGGVMRYVNKSLYSGESVLIPRKGTLSNIMYVNEEFWSVDTMFFTRIKKDNYARYIYYTLKLLDFNNMNVGSAVPSMTTKVLNNLDTLFPSDKTIQVFDNYIKEYYDKIEQNTKQLEKLTQLRGTLLPKLISGELRVPEELIEKE